MVREAGPKRRAAFRPGGGDVGGDDDRRSRAPALDARRHARRAAARREADHAVRRLGRVADRRGRRRRRLAGGARARSTRSPSAGGSAPRARAARSRRARAKTRAGAVLFVGLGQDGSPGTARGAAGRVSRDGRPLLCRRGRRGRGAAARSPAQPPKRAGRRSPLRAFDESLPSLADALRPRPDHPALDARGEGEWHVLRTVTRRRRLDRTRAGGGDPGGRRDGPRRRGVAAGDRSRVAVGSRAPRMARPRGRRRGREGGDAGDIAAGARDRAGLPPLRPRCPPAGRHGARRGGQAPQGRRRQDGQEDLREQGGPLRPPGSEDNPDPHLAQETARNAGTLGLLKQQDGCAHLVDLRPRHGAGRGRQQRPRRPDWQPDR